MDLHKLRIYAAVARLGSFTKAADSLYVTQPTASQQLAQLEVELGTRLFVRGPRKATLTEAGAALLPYAEQILDLAERGAESARAAAGIADSTLRLGMGHTIATYLLPDILRSYRQVHARRAIRISTGNTAELLDILESASVEVALIGTPASRSGIEVTPFMTDRVVAIFPADSAPPGKTVSAAWLRTQPLLVREPGSALYASVEQILGREGLERESVIQLAETEAIKRCVSAGLGIALIQEVAIRDEVEAGALASRPIEGSADERTYAYAVQKRRPLSRAAQDLLSLLSHGSTWRRG
jgi:DNA-binding transcriptional LysR family regulator